MSFHVGQKVVHVRSDAARSSRIRFGTRQWPKEVRQGRILTVRDVDARYVGWYGIIGLRFDEVIYSPNENGVEPAFPADQFRPIVERKTDISIFTEMLTPKKKTLAPLETHREVSAAQSSHHSPHKP